ncbi:MAG: DUF5672 family protein [Pseudomonadota bacterium]
MINPVVIVPVHKEIPLPLERVSLSRCADVLGAYKIILVAPKGLSLDIYSEILPMASCLRIDEKFMANISAYNSMMISPVIVSQLDSYSHMLVHEPDAIVFRDDLYYWCWQPLDYIGAPWFEGYDNAKFDAKIIGIGNSGFSLHNLDALRRITSSKHRWYPFKEILSDIIQGFKGDLRRLQKGLKAIGSAGQLRGAWKIYDGNCDLYWSNIVPKVDSKYRVAIISDALNFSWEALPSRCMELNSNKLPFGMHAWARYDIDFIKPYLVATGVNFDV